MKRGSTHFLRFTLFVLALGALAFCIFALPSMWKGASAEFPYASASVSAIIIILYAIAIPFFMALWQTFKLLSYIDNNTAFSDASVRALKNIKHCAIAVTVLAFSWMPFLFPIAQVDDAPGLILIGGVIACMPIVIAVFAAVLQRLLQNAIDLKSENDLTV